MSQAVLIILPIEFVGGQIVENVACVTAEQYILASDSALRFIGDVVVDPIVFFISVGQDIFRECVIELQIIFFH